MNAENSPSLYNIEFESISKGKESINVVPEPENDIILLGGSDKKQHLLSVLMADIKWTINAESKISYISPYEENCIGNDATYVIKKIVSKYLPQSSIIACLIELEELIDIIRTSKNTKARTLVVDAFINEYNINKVEIASSPIFDLQGNVVGIQGLCQYLI
jgi:hypothetical protein